LFLGWLIGMAVGIWLFVLAGLKPVFAIQAFGNVFGVYIGVLALAANLVVGLGGSFPSLLPPTRNSRSAPS